MLSSLENVISMIHLGILELKWQVKSLKNLTKFSKNKAEKLLH